jgi:uncharacterized protein (TIGR04255 family)
MSSGPRPPYRRPPITEAALDIRVTLPVGIGLDQLRETGDKLGDRFPATAEQYDITAEITSGPRVGAAAHQRAVGYQFRSEVGDRLFSMGLGGFSYNKLAPYERWETVRDEAKEIWSVYRAVTTPETVKRLGLRYINRLDLPLPVSDFRDYLRTIPEISPELPQGLSGYFMRLFIPQDDLGAHLILQEAILPPPHDGVVSILLDIDVFKTGEVPQDNDEIWVFFEQLRLRKNRIFEACITDKARELFS